MESSSTAVAEDLPPTEPPFQQKEDDTIQQTVPSSPPSIPPVIPSSVEEDSPSAFDKRYYRKVNKAILEEDTDELVWLSKNEPRSHVNLMNDPLLSVVIASRKTNIALQLLERLPDNKLEAKNCNGDTALHVAATVGDRKVAKALLDKSVQLAAIRNKKGETPLHKAALYGQREVFQLLVKKGKRSPMDQTDEGTAALQPMERTDEGATALHCAIMGNAPALALEIATKWPDLAVYRNDAGVTPLQLLVTIPEVFRSQLVLGSLDHLLYNCIPLPKEHPKTKFASKQGIRDIEDQDFHGENSEEIEIEEDEKRGRWIPMLFYMILIPICIFLFKLLRRVSPRIRRLCKLKETHRDAMKLIECLATYRGYFGYFSMGQSRDLANAALSRQVRHDNPETKTPQSADKAPRSQSSESQSSESKSSVRDWSEPPLIMGAEMGLNEFVGKILQVCPESAAYVDSHGRNVLQAAIGSGSWEIVEIISRDTAGHNPVLPSWLLSDTRDRRTILHFASERIPPKTDDAMQLQDELLFFETVKDMVPKELVYSRNNEEKTAQEVFSETHEKMLENCKNQLMEMGKTCSGLVAAVVFASSFSIPGEKDVKTGNPVYMNRLPFKVFSHTYVIGLSCAATSLVLFLSLIISPYKEQQFRGAIPTKYFLACLAFTMALLALLVSFTCNIFLQIYGGQRTESDDLIPLILELTVFPALCFIVLYCRGATFWPPLRRIWK